MKKNEKYHAIEMLLRIVTAIILIQTLHFKFTGHPQTVHVFSTIGMEPWGRYGIGAIELVTGILFFLPNLWRIAALVTVALMLGAIAFHLFTPLGTTIEYDGNSDGGQLFVMALLALVFSSALLAKSNLPEWCRNLLKRSPK